MKTIIIVNSVFICVASLLVFTSAAAVELHCRDDEHIPYHPACPGHEPGRPTYLPHPTDCHKFYECSNGNASCFWCAPGTVWDQDNLTCDHEAWTPCHTATPRPTHPPTRPTLPSSTPQEPPTTTQDPAEWVCPAGFDGHIGHPTDCTKFYLCYPGHRPRLFSCDIDLYFNPATSACDWPEKVPACQGGTRLPQFTHSV